MAANAGASKVKYLYVNLSISTCVCRCIEMSGSFTSSRCVDIVLLFIGHRVLELKFQSRFLLLTQILFLQLILSITSVRRRSSAQRLKIIVCQKDPLEFQYYVTYAVEISSNNMFHHNIQEESTKVLPIA